MADRESGFRPLRSQTRLSSRVLGASRASAVAEQRAQARRLEDAADALVGADDAQLALAAPQLARGLHDDAEAGGVHEADSADVNDDVAPAVGGGAAGELAQDGPQARSRRGVELPRDD